MRTPHILLLALVLITPCRLVAKESDETLEVMDATPSTTARSDDRYVEEVVVTAPAPEQGHVPTLERMFQIYESRRRGASLYRQGRYGEALPHLLAAARNGFKFAQARVGFIYQQGLDTPQNPDAAVGWLGVAAQGDTHPEIRNYFQRLWSRIPAPYHPRFEAVVDEYRSKYGSTANRVGCDMSAKAGTHIKTLSCQFMDDYLLRDLDTDFGVYVDGMNTPTDLGVGGGESN